MALQDSNSIQITNLMHAQTGATFSTKSHTFLKDRLTLRISPIETKHKIDLDVLTSHQNIKTPYGTLNFSLVEGEHDIEFIEHTAYLDFDKIQFPLKIKNDFENKKIKPLGMTGKKLISNVLTDRKLNLFQKEKQLLVSDQKQVLWVINQCINDDFKITNETKKILRIKFSE